MANWIIQGTTIFCVVLSLATIFLWLRSNPAKHIVAEVPGTDGFVKGGRFRCSDY
jgi:hypothetical protein